MVPSDPVPDQLHSTTSAYNCIPTSSPTELWGHRAFRSESKAAICVQILVRIRAVLPNTRLGLCYLRRPTVAVHSRAESTQHKLIVLCQNVERVVVSHPSTIDVYTNVPSR